MQSPTLVDFSLKQACVRQFADRPTLRQVASQQILKLLTAELPWIAYVRPTLSDATPFTLDSPDPATPYWTTAPLVDLVLQSLLDGVSLNFEPLAGRTYNLGLNDPYRFPGSHSEFDTRSLHGMTQALNALVQALPEHFRQAQIDYWNGVPCIGTGDCGASRHGWMQQVLRMALLDGVRSQPLSDDAATCVLELLAGRTAGMQINAIEVTLGSAGQERRMLLPDLLVSLERDEDRLVLWCPPSGKVRSYASDEAFALDLRDRLAQADGFDSLVWSRYELEGDPFLQQSGLLLSSLLDRLDHLPWLSIDSVEQLQAWFAQLSDPSEMFFDEARFEAQDIASSLPKWLAQASSLDRFAYQEALLDLALDQALCKGATSLDGILDLHAYTRQRLREQMLADYPQEANYFPDDLVLTVEHAYGVPGGGAVGTGDGTMTEQRLSLTEFALGNLGALGGGKISAIEHRGGQWIMDWMNAGYVKTLVDKLDIGGHYPSYVQRATTDPATRDRRIERFGREWRSQLRFDALKLKVEGGLDLAACQAVTEFCRSDRDLSVNVEIAPLAFKVPGYRSNDTVAGMYVLRLREPLTMLLYRPLFPEAPLRQFTDATALMAAVQQEDELQHSMLGWLNDDAREVYAEGGFVRPRRITGWARTATDALVPIYSVIEADAAVPAQLSFKRWLADVDVNLYLSKVRAMAEMADRQTISHAESRWNRLVEGGWLLFNLVTPVLRGPVAMVAWLASALTALDADKQAWEERDEAKRSLAIMDLVANLSMLLAHSRLPQAGPVIDRAPVQTPRFTPSVPAAITVERGRSHLPGELQSRGAGSMALATAWGPEPAAQLRALQHLATRANLEGVVEDQGGFYRQAGERYVELYGERFRIVEVADDFRIVGPQGQLGPWLWRGEQWKVRLGFFGGMPRREGAVAPRQAKFNQLDREVKGYMQAGDELRPQIAREMQQVVGLIKAVSQHENSLEQLTDGSNDGLSQDQVKQLSAFHREQIARKSEALTQQSKDVIEKLQRATEYDRQVLEAMPRLLELQRFGNIRGYAEGAARDYMAAARKTLVLNSWNIFDELRRLADYPELHRLSNLLNGRPIPEVDEMYRTFKLKLGGVVEIQAGMIKASIDLDTHLPQTPPDTVLVQAPMLITVDWVVSSRTMTTTQLRFHQAMNFTDLALHLDYPGESRRLSRYREAIAGEALKSAASAHAALSTGGLSPSERIEILQNAWDEYSTAIINSIDLSREGGALVELDMLERYVEELKALKGMIGVQLEDAIAEQDGATLPVRYRAYVQSQAEQLAVRTHKGELVVADRVQGEHFDGLEVREPFTGEVLHRFVSDGQAGWVERVEPVPVARLPEDGLAAAGEQLVSEDPDIARKALEYVAADVPGHQLADLIDEHVHALRRLAGEMSGVAGLEQLKTQLDTLGDDWGQRRTDLLIELYDKTPRPGVDALVFMHAQGLLEVRYQGPRQQLANGTAMDEYRIRRIGQGKKTAPTLWVAHFHFEHLADGATDFVRGHLKTWQQRSYGRADAHKLAAGGQRIHRGRLTYEQVRHIFPFH